jgi:hypothetical protein
MKQIILGTFLFLTCNSSLFAATDTFEKRGTSYLNFGAGEEYRVQGYDTGVSRKARTLFFVEHGGEFIAIPLSYSYGQKLNIFGLKPRFQFLIPLDSRNMVQFGPGIGAVVNYWYGNQSVLGQKIDIHVLELGAQLSAHLKVNITPNFNVMISPALVDYNVYRKAWIDTHSPFGTFTDDNDGTGMLYSFAVSAGLTF